MSALTFDPLIPRALWLSLVVLAAGLLLAYALASRSRIPHGRRTGIWVLMAVAVILPLMILLNPTWIEPVPPPAGKPMLTILVDRTASMAIEDASDGASRFAAAVDIAGRMQRQLAGEFDVRVHTAGETTTRVDLDALRTAQPDDGLTDLAQAVEQALEDRPQGQAVLLLSDGIHNASGGAESLRQSAAKARAMTAPVYVQTIGQQSSVRDLEVALRLPQEMAYVGQHVPITVVVRQRGALTDRARLSLCWNDAVVEQQEVAVSADGTSEATFHVMQPARGLYRYEIHVEPQPGEVTDVNNRAPLLLRVVDEPVRILVLEGKPYWDTKFLLRTLSSDPSVDLTAIVRLAEDRYLTRHVASPPSVAGPPAPNAEGSAARTEQWATQKELSELFASGPGAFSQYQVIVLGRDADVYLRDDRVTQLKKWLVEQSGSLVCFRGAPEARMSEQLAELMPVRWTSTRESRFRMQLTESGRAVQWLPTLDRERDLLACLPSLATVAQPQRPQPLAVVLATTTGELGTAAPAITYQPLGLGRVVVVEGAGMWRWAFLAPEHQQFDDAYGTLWRSLTRWLVANAGLLPSQRLALRSDKVTFSTEETATATLLLRESEAAAPPPVVELTGPGLASPQTVVPLAAGAWPGQFRVVFGKLPEGRYRAQVTGATDESSSVAAFDVRGNLTERLDVAARPDLLELLARDSGGAVLDSGDPAQLNTRLHDYLAASRPLRSTRVIAWDRWWVLLLVAGCWGAAWGLRRRSGLV